MSVIFAQLTLAIGLATPTETLMNCQGNAELQHVQGPHRTILRSPGDSCAVQSQEGVTAYSKNKQSLPLALHSSVVGHIFV